MNLSRSAATTLLSDGVARGHTPLGVNHQGNFFAATISFNLPPSEPLPTGVAAIDWTIALLGTPCVRLRGGRRPLRISIVGGQSVSRVLTLCATPVVYLYVEKPRLVIRGRIDRPRAMGQVNKGSHGECITVLITGVDGNSGIFSY